MLVLVLVLVLVLILVLGGVGIGDVVGEFKTECTVLALSVDTGSCVICNGCRMGPVCATGGKHAIPHIQPVLLRQQYFCRKLMLGGHSPPGICRGRFGCCAALVEARSSCRLVGCLSLPTAPFAHTSCLSLCAPDRSTPASGALPCSIPSTNH